ncbi:SDR family NAD(P)-dependent oxidoreductase [Agromyces bauzanensis]|uniref:Short-chain dehydrogenase n=1 Tax=Agromyces bauzanensis TaxID=1308924 RepID=A0A917PUF3_9MICO|nr:SDR family oxidoreductase [Agromyces bauzanensis]GGJ92489.1 short-chain dehydrogenase [Agromyces bauzanensis]
MTIHGRTALVTGSTSGIGRAAAETLAARGARVIITGRDPAKAEAVVAGIVSAGGSASAVIADLADPEGFAVLAGLDDVDILVNNAGYYRFVPTSMTDATLFEALSGANLRAPFFLGQALIPRMIERGGGSVVNVSTVAARVGTATSAAYGASKAGLESLTRAWAAEFGPSGVRVNAVAAGPTHTPGTDAFLPVLEALTAATPAGRPLRPEEVADAIAYLAEADYLHGASLVVDGGASAVAPSR